MTVVSATSSHPLPFFILKSTFSFVFYSVVIKIFTSIAFDASEANAARQAKSAYAAFNKDTSILYDYLRKQSPAYRSEENQTCDGIKLLQG